MFKSPKLTITLHLRSAHPLAFHADASGPKSVLSDFENLLKTGSPETARHPVVRENETIDVPVPFREVAGVFVSESND